MIKLSVSKFAFSNKLPSWATADPYSAIISSSPVQQLLNGQFINSKKQLTIIDPLNGNKLTQVSLAEGEELNPFIQSQLNVPNYGLHNPIKNVHRYNMYGDIFFQIAEQMRKPIVQKYLSHLVQRVMPKSIAQTTAQVVVTRKFFENFTGDNARFFQQSFNVAGDHDGQTSTGYRWPLGNVCCITPFNFPIEIPALQLFGALITGNRPLLKCDTKMSIVMEQVLRMAAHCGLPLQDVNFINCSNHSMSQVIDKAKFKVVQFTGSSQVAQKIAKQTNGKVRLEDSGFDWKILGPNVHNLDYVAWVSDQDTYAATGQKCSAQSVLFIHENWMQAGFLNKIKKLAQERNLKDLTIGPVITWNNAQIQEHVDAITKLEGTELLFGGKVMKSNIPQCYGSYYPTAVQVPLSKFASNMALCAKELFGPFQVVVPYKGEEIDEVISCINRMQHHLTAGIVENDPIFLDKVLGQTTNGVTYTGIRGRTTGAPQNHWFGPSGDPRGAGIGTKEAILTVWTTHREIVRDYGPIPKGWTRPKQS